MAYIYMTTNLVNGKRYIGKSNKSSSKTKFYLGSGKLLRAAIAKYGKRNFEKSIIVEGAFNANFLNELEKHYIQLYGAHTRSDYYNISAGGETPSDDCHKKYIYRYNNKGVLTDIYYSTFSEVARKFKLYAAEIAYACKHRSFNKKAQSYFSLLPISISYIKPKSEGYDIDIYTRQGAFVATFNSCRSASGYLNCGDMQVLRAYHGYKQGVTASGHYVVPHGTVLTIDSFVAENIVDGRIATFYTYHELLKFLAMEYNLFKDCRRQLATRFDKGIPYKEWLTYKKDVKCL